MRIKRENGGYTTETFNEFIGSPRCRILLGAACAVDFSFD